MKKFILVVGFAIFSAAFLITTVTAQETEEPAMFLVFEELVSPADLPKFWEVQTEAIKTFDEHEFDMKFTAFQTDANSFYWAIPIKNFASIDELYAKMKSQYKVMLENGYNPSEKFRDLSRLNHFVVRHNKDLSYHSEEKTEDAAPDKFFEWTFFHLKSGHEKEASEAAKKYIEFYDNIEEDYGWNIYEIVLGNNTPCWILEVSGESEVTLRKLETELMEKYKEDFQKLWMDFIQHVDDTEMRRGWLLPDWSR